jgi:hypothetical protein
MLVFATQEWYTCLRMIQSAINTMLGHQKFLLFLYVITTNVIEPGLEIVDTVPLSGHGSIQT